MNIPRILSIICLVASVCLPLSAAERKLDIKDGDRVLLIGDVLVEREK